LSPPNLGKASTAAAPAHPSEEVAGDRPRTPASWFASRQFTSWLEECDVSLAVSAYQSSSLMLVGRNATGKASVHRRSLPRCMGLAVVDGSLFVSSRVELWRFDNVMLNGSRRRGYDRVYLPRICYITGDIDIHDMAVDRRGRLLFVSALYSCVATVSERYNFVPVWTPPFISRLAAEDRCHLNGLALVDGEPRYATSIAEVDVADGWRDHRRDGGCLIDVGDDRVIAHDLSMPHSPRVYRGVLYLHNSGTGEFGQVDPGSGVFTPIAFLPGYLRGLDFIDEYAVVGVSRPRHNREFLGLDLQERLAQKRASPRCGVYVIDLRSGDLVHWLQFEGVVHELFDVAVLRGCSRPMCIGFESDEVRRTLTFPHGPSLADPTPPDTECSSVTTRRERPP
jgi:uncharacterized protein (TIGR03032 family)